MVDDEYKEVRFDIYCEKCKHGSKPEHFDPCNECLGYPCNENSSKPIKWEEKK